MHNNSMEFAQYDSDIAPTRRRLERSTYMVLAAMMITALLTGNLKVMLGIVLGGALGLINHRWLSASLGIIIPEAAHSHRVPRWTASKFILRYLVIGSAIGLALWSGWFDLLAIVAGFCAFVGALMIETVYQVYIMVAHREE
jgi:hypothetical protein